MFVLVISPPPRQAECPLVFPLPLLAAQAEAGELVSEAAGAAGLPCVCAA